MADKKFLPQAERLLSGVLSTSLGDSDTEMTVNNPPSASKLPTYIELEPDSDDNRETVRAVDVVGDVVTIERGVYNGGVGFDHLANVTYKEKITQKHWDAVVLALETGYLMEDSAHDLTRLSTSSFSIAGIDRTAYYTQGRIVRINGSVIVTVVSSTFNSPDTEVTVLETTVPTPITSVELGIGPAGDLSGVRSYPGSLDVGGSTVIDAILDEDDMASDSDTAVPTQQAVKAFGDGIASDAQAYADQVLVDAMAYTDSEIAALPSASVVDGMYRNALINGGFDVWQRATTFTTPNDDTFGPDRWNFLLDGNGSWTFTQSTDVPTGDFEYSLKCTNVTLNKQCGIVQILEFQDAKKFQGKDVSLSFYAKTTSSEISKLRATVLSWDSTLNSVTSDVIGTWAGNGTDPTFATNWTKEKNGSDLTLTDSWQRFTIEDIAIDTSGMNNLAVVIWVDDTTIAANDDFWITGVQLNVGETAVDWNPRTYGEEYALCQRFCLVFTLTGTQILGQARNESTTRALLWLPFPVPAFRTPTLTATAADWQVMHAASSTDATAIQLFGSPDSKYGALVGVDVASGLTAGQASQIRADGGGTRVLILNAEL